MKRSQILKYATPALLAIFLLAAAVSCRDNGDDPKETESDTLPSIIETVPDTSLDTEPETEPETEPTVSSVKFPTAALPDYARYASAGRIKEVLGSRPTYAFAISGGKHYVNGELKNGGDGVLAKDADGKLIISGSALASYTGKTELADGTPEEVAKALGMGVAVYDKKVVLFYEGAEPLHTYTDLYTYEAMFLYMKDATAEEIVNAFITIPDKISNDTSNTIFYTAPDLNLGLQTSIYYSQIGQINGLHVGPSIVAGEGKHAENYTTVRVFNQQQMCTAQFLAFDASVMGGVQVAAGQVGNETLIATAAFADHDGANGDVRVFDTAGMIRMTIRVRDVFAGPYTIATGHFADGVADEVLLIASQNTDAEGKLSYVIVSLADGSLISKNTLDCSFALADDKKAGAPVQISVRNVSGGTDSVILYFPSVQGVFEGSAQKGEFANAGINLPADAIGVSASNQFGEKYVIALPAREGTQDQSFITVYADGAADGRELDVGFKENRFYSARHTDGYNDDKYVSMGNFHHIRTDLQVTALGGLTSCNTNAAIDKWFEEMPFEYWKHNSSTYSELLKTEYLMLEPCFTHRWNKIPQTGKLAAYIDPETGEQRYVSVGKSGEYLDYNEIGSEFYVGTYADGILELGKLRLYPIRSFVQQTAIAFRGEGANPEHLVGMSPVHEHEVNVPGSVGDYNPYMVEGFRHYLIDRYGSLENINTTFGTSFATFDEIDPPRDKGRGEWDKYDGSYLTDWAMYNRYIVSKRIMESYREALLAGYPPESISAHQIPEGDAVSGFLGDADTRLSPIDIVLSCGTAYGGTRYGYLHPKNNFLTLASKMGHSNITLGEYGSLQERADAAYKQLEGFWSNGLRMVHHISFTDAQAKAEYDAIQMLEEKNAPRPGYTGGTTNAIGITAGEKSYRIVQIGAGEEKEGLLKSIDANGKWEGTVYVVPFHAKMNVETLTLAPVDGANNRLSTGRLGALENADQVEITLEAASSVAGSTVTFQVYHDGFLLDQATTTYTLTETMTPYRFVLANQLYEEGLEVVVTIDNGSGAMDGVTVQNLKTTMQTEATSFQYYSGNKAHRLAKSNLGGVTFDIITREYKD